MERLTLITEMMHAAGQIAMDHFLQVRPIWKDNRSYVTEADLAVQAHLIRQIEQHFPEDGIIAEEEEARKDAGAAGRTWIIDPIDGTASFVAGMSGWGIALGVLERGKPAAGFFLMPATGDLFYTTPQGVVYRNDQPVRMKPPAPVHRESLLLTISRIGQRFTLAPGYPGKVLCMGSAVAHFCYVAAGGADALLLDDVYVWDLAAGLPLLLNNGGVFRYLDGTPVDLAALLSGEKVPGPMLGGHVRMVDHFLELLTHRTTEDP